MANFKVYFRFGRIHADLMGAFGFLAGGYFNLATPMVFGSNTSASSWEPFCCTIKTLFDFFVNQKDLAEKHRKYLDMLSWADDMVPPPDHAQAIPCLINKGVIDEQGNKVLLPAQIYINDAFMLVTSKACMQQVLTALIEAIIVVMGEPDTDVCQALAMDYWSELFVGPKQVMLGLVIGTNKMTVGIPVDYIKGVCSLIDSTWHVACQCFTVQEAQELMGKLGHLAEGVNWVFHLLTHLFASIAL
jgi:hypothetical protein